MVFMEIVNIKKIKSNPKNPRIIKNDKFKKLVQSIKEFPQMIWMRPLVIDENNIVLWWNMRLKALQELWYTEIPVNRANWWTQEEKEQFIIKDNVWFGEWNWDDLANEWDTEKLVDWGLDLPVDFGEEEPTDLDWIQKNNPFVVKITSKNWKQELDLLMSDIKETVESYWCFEISFSGWEL